MAENDYAIVVGINRYPNPPLADLDGPENDALGFKEWLLSPSGGNLPDAPDHIRLILSRDFHYGGDPLSAQPTTLDVDRAFEEIIVRVSAQPPGRRLYVFLAGHGIAPPSGLDDAALLMANAGYGRMGHNIPGRTYAQSFREAAFFQELVLLMDCCRDSYLRARMHSPPWDVIQRLDAVNVRYFYGFATKWSRKARERQLESQGAVRGLFSHAVLAVLKSGRLTGSQLRDCVFNYLPKLTGENEYQEPEFFVDPHNDIVFSEAASPARLRVRVSFTPQSLGQQVEIGDSDFNSRGVHLATSQPWELELELGKYRIRDLTTGRQLRFDLIGGGTIHVEF